MENKYPIRTMRKLQPGDFQYCLHQVGKTDKYRLLRSPYPNKNIPAVYSVELARGTVDEMILFKKQIVEGLRDENGRVR